MVGDENDKAEGLKRRGVNGGVRDEAGAISEEEEEEAEDIITAEGWFCATSDDDWDVRLTGAESQMIRSADLWDARTDSRFVPWNDKSKR